jgi:hypothetical protein
MKRVMVIAAIAALVSLALSVQAAEDDAKARDQFQQILDGFNSREFEMIEPAIDKADLINRVLSVRPLANDVKQMLSESFAEMAEGGFLHSIHNPTSSTAGEVVSFEFENGKGLGVIRVKIPNYQYAYLTIELRHDKRGRLKIVDWFDSRIGQNLTTSISDVLITLRPTKESTRRLLTIQEPTDLQLFQATEILKASRDPRSPQFFEIYADIDDALKRQALIAKFAVRMAVLSQDADQFVNALKIFVDIYAAEKEFAAVMSDYFIQIQAYPEAYDSLKKFHEFFDVKEGALPARLSAIALALGNLEESEQYAVEATLNEPTLELGWWSLLRARANAEDYEGAIEALSSLEDNFGQRLDEPKLRRDKFRGFVNLAASQEFKDWRAGRD